MSTLKCRVLALIAGLTLVVLVLAGSGVQSTLAGWKDAESPHATFTAGSIGPVQSMQCADSGTLLGLAGTEIQLDWALPAGAKGSDISYEVTWKQTGLLGGSGTQTVQTPKYVYKNSGIVLLGLGVTFTVRAKSKSGGWTGPITTVKATSLSILGLGVVLRCQ